MSPLLLLSSSSCLSLRAQAQETAGNLSPSAAGEELTVTGEGMAAFTGDVAAAQEEAVWDAKRNAVEQAVGIFLKAKTVGSGFGVEDDEVQGRTQGFVRRWEVVEGSRRIEGVPGTASGAKGAARILHIQVRATVGLLPLARRLSDIADVYKDLERPRVRVSITAAPGRAKHKRSPAKNKAGGEGTQDKEANPSRAANVGAAADAPRVGGAADSEAAARVQEQLAGQLRSQGFDVADEGSAEVVLRGTLDVVPTVRIGDASAPYGVGDMVAACRARLSLQAISTASEDVLFARQIEGAGRSFQSDQDAQNEAVGQVVASVLSDSEAQFVPTLLAHWARERQEGHVVIVRADGLTPGQAYRLRQAVSDMRGFRRFIEDGAHTSALTGAGAETDRQSASQASQRVTLRFLTRRDTRSLRRDLAVLALPSSPANIRAVAADTSANTRSATLLPSRGGAFGSRAKAGKEPAGRQIAPVTLIVLNDRGPIIHCAAYPSAGSPGAHR